MNIKMRICALSDIHGAWKKLHYIGQDLEAADMVVIAGDLTRHGLRKEAMEVFSTIEQYNPHILAVHGNWDRLEVQDLIDEKKYGLHGRGAIIGGIGFFGVGGSNRTPVRTPSEYNEEELYEIVQSGYRLVEHAPVKVLVSHSPPRGVRDTTFLKLHGGSTSIRDFLQESPVNICHCGHIHEACGNELLGDTMVVNSGSLRSGMYYNIFIDGTTISYEKKKARKPSKK